MHPYTGAANQGSPDGNVDGVTEKAWVIVINDDETQRTTLCDLLRRGGWLSKSFAEAEAALAGLTGNPVLPSLIITDITMPGMDGWRFCRLLRSREYERFNAVPILVVSDTSSREDAARISIDTGANAYLPFPVECAPFLALVERLAAGREPGAQPKVLIVEDSRTLTGLLNKAFTAGGYETLVAATLAEGRLAFRHHSPDIVILDYHLPDGNGDLLLAEFQKDSPSVVAIMMTADQNPELALAWMKQGAAAYVHKPFDPAYLLELCQKARREREMMLAETFREERLREICRREEALRLVVDHQRSQQHHLALVNRLAFDLLSLSPQADIHGFVAERLADLTDAVFVGVNEYDRATDRLITRAFAGLPTTAEKFLEITGQKPVGASYGIESDAARTELGKGRLVRIAGGLHELTFKRIPQMVCLLLEKTFHIGEIYAIGIVHEGRLHGSAVICLKSGSQVQRELVEAFAALASLAFQRQHAGESLAERERELSTLMNNLPGMVYRCLNDSAGTITVASKECLELTGYSGENLQQGEKLSFQDFVHPEDRPRVWNEIEGAVAANLPYKLAYRIVPAGGGVKWVWEQGVGVRDGKGDVAFLEGFIIDVTDHRRAEANLRRLATAADQAAEAICITDTDGRIEYVNPAFERISGYGSKEAVGQSPRILNSGVQDRPFYEELWKTITAGKTWSGRIVNKRKGGTLYTEDCTISPVRDEKGAIERFVAVKRDVSREIEMENQFRQSQRLESIGQLAAGVAHDLNNLLSPILGYADLLLLDMDPAGEAHRQVREIVKAGQSSRDLIGQLLAFGRRQMLELRVMDLRRVVAEMESLLRRMIRENIALETDLAPDFCNVLIDRGQFEQVLMNLAVNAEQAMPDGGSLLIEVGHAQLDAEYCKTHTGVVPGHYIQLTVSDTGEGMDDEVLTHIFEPFYTTKGKLGTGLGLATVYGIVKQHKGNIWVYSEPGRGTTFKVYLPSSREKAVDLVGQNEASPPGGAETILVVEDSAMVMNLARAILEKRGYRVLVAASGAEAIRVLEEYRDAVHLLLTDVIMPDINGKELYDRVSPLYPALKVLFMSGYTQNVIAHHGVLDKGVFFIQKPFTVQGLTVKVREILSS